MKKGALFLFFFFYCIFLVSAAPSTGPPTAIPGGNQNIDASPDPVEPYPAEPDTPGISPIDHPGQPPAEPAEPSFPAEEMLDNNGFVQDIEFFSMKHAYSLKITIGILVLINLIVFGYILTRHYLKSSKN